ncbi:hypothetical protein NFI96_002061 [Prochilodus magdalenae]|nr:hypothetical protein NFI96_002061 [Prochilodus magdalenae]
MIPALAQALFCMMASVVSGLQDSSIEELHLQRKGQRLPYQIFPNSEEDSEVLQSPAGQRGRLPSIVVDPTQVSEGQRGGLLWPLQRHASTEEDEDSFQEQDSTQNHEPREMEQGNAEGSGDERCTLKQPGIPKGPTAWGSRGLEPGSRGLEWGSRGLEFVVFPTLNHQTQPMS